MRLLELFCDVDAFCHTFLPQWNLIQRVQGQRLRRQSGQRALRAVMTIVIHFHHMRFHDFNTYHLAYVRGQLRREFPQAVS